MSRDMPACPRKIFQPGFLSALILVAVIGWLIYAGALRASFQFDDIMNIVENPYIRMTAFTPSEIARSFQSFSSNRPLANASFAVNYYFHGYEVSGYRLINLLIHMITALLVFIVTRQTLTLLKPEPPASVTPAPLLAALLWLVNPLHVQSVTYVVQRMNSLAALFYLLSLACYIGARQRGRTEGATGRVLFLFGLCLLAALAGLVSKETAATLPLIILACEWYFFRDLDPAWLKKQRWWLVSGLLIILGLGLIYTNADPAAKLAFQYGKQDFTMGQRLLTQPLVVLYYLSLILFPHPDRLSLVHNFPLSTGLFSPPATLPALAAIAALAVFIIAGAGRHRLLSFALLWFLVTLSIESSFLGLALAFEHRTYLPSVFPVIALTCLMLDRLKPTVVAAAAAVVLIVCGAVWTHQRNQAWQNDISLWTDNAAKNPTSAVVFNNLGLARMQSNQTDRAEAAFRQALTFNPRLETALNNLGTILRDRGEAEAAIALYRKAIEQVPHFQNAWYNLGLAWFDLGRLDRATAAFEKAVSLNPLDEKAHNNLGIALMQQDYPEQALGSFQRTIELNPAYKKAYSNAGIALMRQGKIDSALATLKKAMDIDPFYIEAYNNIRRIQGLEQEHGEKIRELEELTTRHPGNANLLFQLGEVYAAAGRTAAAMSQYRAALEVQPDHLPALNSLSNLFARRQRYEEAAAAFETMAKLLPASPIVRYNLACMRARTGRIDEALADLARAIELGYDNFERIKIDPDLENIRDTEYYKKMIRQ